MAPANEIFQNRTLRLDCAVPSSKVALKNALVREGMNQLSETRVEILCNDETVDLQDFVGRDMNIVLEEKTDRSNKEHWFSGTCTSVEFVGYHQGFMHLVAEVRPFLWFLTKRQDSRIFQEMTAVEIIKSVLSDYGFSGDVEDILQSTYEKRVYCVQYRETDFSFISRLMEEEGIYFFFKQVEKELQIVLGDGISAHAPIQDKSQVPFYPREDGGYRRDKDHIFEWSDQTKVTSGKVTLDDFNFEKPKSDLKKAAVISKGSHKHTDYEVYDYPGRFMEAGLGESRTRVKMEAKAAQHLCAHGIGTVRGLRVGKTFSLEEHPKSGCNQEYLTITAVHHLKIETDYEEDPDKRNPFLEKETNLKPPENDREDTYSCEFETIPARIQYRAPTVTQWPSISGIHTAIVTGPSGEEIYTDKYGRIKVQFHWDRFGKKDEKTSCWVRCVMPWTGKNWGMISIPRIGQEVVIQFEEGDPDRPMCTGMLYNDDTQPPYALPDNMTQSGIVTRSTKTGSAGTFNELIFEDKKDAEFVRMQSEKDYTQTIKNNAEITIGLEKQDDGDLTQTIHRHKTETLNTGDHTFTVESGNQTIFVKTDHQETIEGKSTQEITGDTSQTVSEGNYTQDVDAGDVTRKIAKGDEAVTVSMGDYSLKTTAGSIKEQAGTKIELKVGANSITIDNSGVTIKGVQVKIEGTAMIEAKSPMTTVKGDATLILKGGITLIN